MSAYDNPQSERQRNSADASTCPVILLTSTTFPLQPCHAHSASKLKIVCYLKCHTLRLQSLSTI